ncbi:MAG TPA: hypothetical protein VGO91_11250 [Pyrinomonadaceae bacterium]|jgi:hypothetical protein|nr:hypothetical protein [Pyrinomonadaceae bacterium]
MFYSSTKSFRPGERRNYRTSAWRFAASLLLALCLPLIVSAYTIVMRDGRRLEIPEKFVVTPATLTYEVAPDISITLQMSTIDIEATERANKEPSGSLLSRAQEQATTGSSSTLAANARRSNSASQSSSSTPQRALRTITNRDLEASRRAREASEAAYERRRRELGLPALALTRQRAEEEASRAREELRRSLSEDAQAEAYWRAQASELRGRLASLNAQMDYVRGLLAGLPDQRAAGSYAVLTSIAPLIQGRGVTGFLSVNIGPSGLVSQPRMMGNRNIFVAPNTGPQLTARVGFGGGATRGQVFLNTTPLRRGFGHQGFFPQSGFASPVALFGSAYPNDAFYDYDRSALVQRLRELELERAGLQARWRVLEDEARRAGASPGWLRP